MNRSLTALFSAFEALLVVGIGIGIPLVPLTILWAFQYDLGIDWIVFWRAAADSWLLGNGTDIAMTLDPALAAGLNLPGAGDAFVITIAPLGFALLAVLLGARAGRRISETPHELIGVIAAIGTYAALSLGIVLSTLYPSARPSIWQGTLLPTLVFALGVGIGILRGHRRRALRPGAPEWRIAGVAALRGGAASAAMVMGVSAILLALAMLTSYAKIIGLYESAHSAVLGGVALTVGQLAFLPNLVIFTMSWLVGPGFAIGTGSSVGPVGTVLGPLPGIPVLGALPEGDLGWGFLGLLVPVLAGFLAGVLIRPRLVREFGSTRSLWLLAAGVGVGVAGGIVLGLLAWFSAGAAGPGRLVDVGPSPWLVGGFAAAEIGVAAVLALLVGGRMRQEDRQPAR